jgi:hypothetical protein
MNKRDASPERAAKNPTWLTHLKEHGYAVVPNVISQDKIDSYKTRFWEWMSSFGTNLNEDPATWESKNWPPSIRGLLQHYGIGHAKFVWDLRCEAAVLEVFSKIWKDSNLLVSFDGACLSKPAHIKKNLEKDSWAHIDQGPAKAGQFECIQGLMTFTEAGPGLGGLLVYKDSAQLHKKFFKRFPELAKSVGNADWCKLEVEHRDWYFRHGAVEVQPAAPAGSILLWDSRTVHWAARPSQEQKHCRMAVYLCYVPRSKATKKDLEKKQKAFLERRMTSHWPAKPRLFAKAPRTYGNEEAKKFTDRKVISDSEVTETIRKLAGF